MKSNLVVTFALFLSLVVSSMGTAHAQEPTGAEYVVQAGDWLAKIAREVYGDPLAYPAIVEATNARAAEDSSFAVIADPNLIEVGQKLWIPALRFVGMYTASLPAASSPGRDIVLFLSADGAAELSTDYLNGEAPIVEIGTWQEDAGGTATVSLTGRPGGPVYDQPDVITFQLEDGTLTAVEYDPAMYGSEGLSLEKQIFPGIYKGFLPAASSPGRDITLFLNPEAQASLKTDYLNGEPLIVEVGTWEAGDDGSLTLTITGREDADYEAPKVISFEVVDGVLTTSPDEDAYGQTGLQLYRFEVIAMASTNQAMPSPAPAAAVSGTVTYLQRIALPPNAVVEVKLVDVSRQDVPATVLGEQIITNPGQVPIPFEIAYDPASIDPRFTYAVQARIMADGQLLFISDTVTPVITRGAPTSDVEIVVVPVGS